MKRTPLRRRVALRPVSKARVAANRKRAVFTATFLQGRRCEMAEHSPCFGTLTVHESINRSHQGAIVPGQKAREQGQTFHALCAGHHSYVTTHPRWAIENGYMQRGVK